MKLSKFSILISAVLIISLSGCTQNSSEQISPLRYKTDSNSYIFDTIYLEALGKTYKSSENITEYQSHANMGGNTSIRNEGYEDLKWKTQGYFMRNRDLGQVFIPKKDSRVQAIVLRTGPAESAVLYDTPGSKVFMQFFEITGEPVINDNGTPVGTQSTHGFSTNHRTDDFIEGVEYNSFQTIFTGIFPEEIPITRDSLGNISGDDGRLYYIRWRFDEPVFFKANHKYGFMIGFVETGQGLGVTLANSNSASRQESPSLDDSFTPYKGGWSFRREGDGTLPPSMFPGENPPDSDSLKNLLKSESVFKEGSDRYSLSPTSNGFPDVDTYRAFEFYIEEFDENLK